MVTDWNPLLRDQFELPYWLELQQFVDAGAARSSGVPAGGRGVHGAAPHALRRVKVMILGQDPYHGPGQAHGLRFSVRRGVRVPPSLTNIHKELHADLGVPIPDHGNLEAWAQRGVLLLNATLTVRGGAAASHQKHGWETFTDRVIQVVGRQGRTRGVRAVGSFGAAQAHTDRHHPPHDHRVAPPVTAVGPQRILRQSTVQPHECSARRSRARSCRLGSDRPGKRRRVRMQH